MPTILQGKPYILGLDPGEMLTVTADALSSGLVRRVSSSGNNLSGYQINNVAASSKVMCGPFPTVRQYSIECAAGSLVYTMTKSDYGYSVLLGNVEAFTGNRILSQNDNGKLLRCDDSSNVTITVNNDLAEGFNVGFGMWGSGTVTIAAASGATNRSSTSALSTQYQLGSLVVIKNGTGKAAEFALGGSFA